MARYIQFQLPVEWMTGKLTGNKEVCNSTKKDSYYIGMRKRASGHKYFATRLDWRTSAPTARELECRNLFKQAQLNTTAALQDQTTAAAYKAKFKAQKKYSTLRGFVFAEEYKILVNAD